ncbi:ATPase [Agrobacterium phage Atu_ph02]|uniref:3'-phosphatase, 5'-polynucleotide kinase n=1 Tax=Agrobacterium phage Atu_ph02 TaxID=2024261 RepID=A0A223W0L6_9CAUD|nr:ATPase [Agrobacterium phage Atu_ph02]ASV44558.1 hypothetical protein [Agrobacterium phage Atu_ph02]
MMHDKDHIIERQLILLRGMPGAGKSTMAKWLVDNMGHRNTMIHVEGDQWRGFGDERQYNGEFNHNAHAYAIGKTADLLRFHHANVVVSNVFPTRGHLKPFFDIAKELNARKVAPFYNIKVTVMHVQGPLGRSVQSPKGKGCNRKANIDAYKSVWEDYNGEFG